MGNEKSNSLPQCQLSNIQKLVDQLYMRKRHENHDISVIGPTNYFILEPSVSKKKRSTSGSPRPPTRFWMDTLCVPVDNYDLRKKAIGRMRTIYTEAHRTLVLDSWIRSLSRKASQNERGACLFLSNWQSRLWTFNEGLLARNLFFQFKDGPGSHSEMKREAVQESRESDGKVVHNIGRHLLQQIPMFDLQVASPEIKAMIKTNYRLLLYTIPLRLRSTTNKSDETLCLATLLDFNPEPLLLIKKIPKELRTDWTFEQEEAEEERVCKEGMALFLQMVGDLGPSIIFNTLPRLPLRGFQWAPRTFLGHKTHGSGIYEGAEHLWLDTHHLSGGKILGPGGILVTAPGAQLEVLENHNSTGAISALMVSLEETDSTGLCVITPGIGEPAEFPLWQIGARYGILCEAPIDSGEEIKAAILVMIDDCETKVEVEGDWMRVLHICRIKLHFADAVEILDSGDGSAISAKFLNKVKKRNWCVM